MEKTTELYAYKDLLLTGSKESILNALTGLNDKQFSDDEWNSLLLDTANRIDMSVEDILNAISTVTIEDKTPITKEGDKNA